MVALALDNAPSFQAAGSKKGARKGREWSLLLMVHAPVCTYTCHMSLPWPGYIQPMRYITYLLYKEVYRKKGVLWPAKQKITSSRWLWVMFGKKEQSQTRVRKTVWNQDIGRHIDGGIEHSRNRSNDMQWTLTCNRGDMADHREKEELFNKWIWENCTYGEKWKLMPTLYHI